MQARFTHTLDSVPAAQWDALAGPGQPFVTHRFLRLLETTGCVGPGTGWQPHHLLIERDGQLVAAAPAYLKAHSWGEYVFDFAWARAYERAGLRYYPRLVLAVPFTPVTGPRLLCGAHGPDATLAAFAQSALAAQAGAQGWSSVHWLFPDAAQAALLTGPHWLARPGVQVHWHNAGYADFEAYLATFTAEKRKKARRERRAVAEAGVTLDVVSGAALDDADWRRLHRFYLDTVVRHGGQAYLNEAFFGAMADVMGRDIVVVRAWRRGRWVAAALNMRGDGALYGRYWGCSEDIPGLHFEVCYHHAVQWCIEHGVARYEAGAQGEHKLARGFVPVATHSVHHLTEPRFAAAVDSFLAGEREQYAQYREALMAHAPYRQGS